MDIKRTVKQVAETLGIRGKLKKLQTRAVNDVMEGHDLLVIAPTSYGKSAIFQIPALLKGGLTIVVVPTLSLLHDQVEQLRRRQIPVGALASDCVSWNECDISSALDRYGLLLLYTTPESLWKLDLSDIPVSLLVVDECHCVTAWGYGFRRAYLELGRFVDLLSPRPQVVALTATAPPEDREQIRELLHMERVREHTASLYRPKLTFSVCPLVSEEARRRTLKRLLKQHRKDGGGACIIYCCTKKMTEAVYKLVRQWYPGQAAICHSNLPGGTRRQNERAFLRGERTIMAATSAFGMGVDKPDVRLVIHYGLPLSLIDYYQQAGRAGRDGGKARCVLLYRKSDYDLGRYILESCRVQGGLERPRAALDEMKEYADGKGCMVQRMLSALGERLDRPCGRCTCCQRGRVKG